MSNRKGLKSLVGIAIVCYVISWPLSGGVHYSYHTDSTYQQLTPATIRDVDVKVHLYSVNSSWQHSWVCPFIVTGKSWGPHTVVVRFDDPDLQAEKYRINSAQLHREDGSSLQLHLATDHPATDNTPWYPFFKNASAWIGHVHHDGEVALSGQFTLELDATVEKNGNQHQEVFVIQMAPTEKKRQGLAIW